MNQLGQSINRIDDVARLISKIIEVIIDTISANTMKNSVIITIVILDIVFGMVRIADTCQTVVVVGVGCHLSFLRHVRCLLCQDIAERVVGERRDVACRVVDLRAAVSHIVNRRGDRLTPDTINYGNIV